ncbi:hypothetical protein SAMN05880501_1142 [Ureibacillus xyleni]|uniref:Uncharacterized protein n=2 Tax=Ureibacillus xyleni TaxID=614648 RepID=A0A285TNF2_9BACL|nr:hypothetical protein SAMN05880501_1142 [Ureibacillus xyleni]
MNISVDEFTRVKEENTKLKQLVRKYQKRIANSVDKKEVEFILNNLIPTMDEEVAGYYEIFSEMSCPKLTYLELIKLITLLFKTNRADLATFYCQQYITEKNLDEVKEITEEMQEEYQKVLTGLSKEVLKKNSTEVHLKIYFEIFSYQPNLKLSFVIFPQLLEQNIYNLTNKIFDLRNDYWLLKLFFIVSYYCPKLIQEYLDYLASHWDIINRWVKEENLPTWEFYVNLANHTQMKKKVTALKEYYQAKSNGLKSPALIEPEPSISNNQIDTKQWEKCSEVRKYGYELKNKTIEQRRVALQTAMKHIPLSKIQSHIHWLLQNSYKKNGVHGDFSKAINAYEMDLEYLQKFFYKDL